MDDSKITAENAPQYQKDLRQFVDSMTEEDWHGDEPEDKSPEAVEPEYKKDIHGFVDSMEQK